ncbi:hypothetical protein DYB32_009306 [Aphanomyces invadans]|uniref:Protein root UVB sensitive/RUS domain-containing protein n=1 Tax=Aphanomyces invadans TaxID=157072 RepID=A0A3R7A349_9STRA|nr:hypothetical protein DYB32_009306 [Aphanomyces invadans]
MRDGSGMLGGLFFAYIVGPKFDANVKFWRLYADVINDFGLTLGRVSAHARPDPNRPVLDMLAPFFPLDEQYVLWEDAAGHIHVFLSVHAKPVDELRAFYHAAIVLTSPAKGSGALAMMQQEFPLFYETMHQHEWKLTHIPLGAGYVRFKWE